MPRPFARQHFRLRNESREAGIENKRSQNGLEGVGGAAVCEARDSTSLTSPLPSEAVCPLREAMWRHVFGAKCRVGDGERLIEPKIAGTIQHSSDWARHTSSPFFCGDLSVLDVDGAPRLCAQPTTPRDDHPGSARRMCDLPPVSLGSAEVRNHTAQLDGGSHISIHIGKHIPSAGCLPKIAFAYSPLERASRRHLGDGRGSAHSPQAMQCLGRLHPWRMPQFGATSRPLSTGVRGDVQTRWIRAEIDDIRRVRTPARTPSGDQCAPEKLRPITPATIRVRKKALATPIDSPRKR